MREQLRNELLVMLNDYADGDTLKIIGMKLDVILSDYEIENRKTDVVEYEYHVPESVQIYIVSKKIAGLSDKTLYLYDIVLKDFFMTIKKQPHEVSAIDIRGYLYTYQKINGVSNRTLDGKRTVICTYFAWLAAEEYIPKNPAVNIKPIKYERKHKKPMSQLELEQIRSVCTTKREKAIVEMLYSTGCRVSELEHLNITDVNFDTKEVILFGKGSKHRTSYLNAKAEFALKEYLAERTDNNLALFVYKKKPYGRLRKAGIEKIIKNIVQRTSDVRTHVTPHVFRHTTASVSLDHGMNIVDVSKLLGHESLDTTMQYITSDQESVRSSHLKCIV